MHVAEAAGMRSHWKKMNGFNYHREDSNTNCPGDVELVLM